MTGAPRQLARRDLDCDPFPPSRTATLFAAVLVDDEVDQDLSLPDTIQFAFRTEDLAACFRLARQLWIEGFDRGALTSAAITLMQDRDLSDAGRTQFKHARAKFKHLRYAHALYGTRHGYPVLLNRMTVTMGQVQDAYRHGRSAAVLARATLLRLLLTRPAATALRRESDRLMLTTSDAFGALLRSDFAILAQLLEWDEVVGTSFHAARKVVGRQVSFWDTIRTLEPTEDRYRMSRWLSAINGRMGALHDDLVERRATDAAAYHAAFVLPDEIRRLIQALLEKVDVRG